MLKNQYPTSINPNPYPPFRSGSNPTHNNRYRSSKISRFVRHSAPPLSTDLQSRGLPKQKTIYQENQKIIHKLPTSLANGSSMGLHLFLY